MLCSLLRVLRGETIRCLCERHKLLRYIQKGVYEALLYLLLFLL